MLKHLPDDVLKTFQGDILYSKKPVIIKGNAANTIDDRRNHIAAAARNSNTELLSLMQTTLCLIKKFSEYL